MTRLFNAFTCLAVLWLSEPRIAAQTPPQWPRLAELRQQWTNRPFAELERAAESGDRTAQHYLAVCYATGERVSTNVSLALKWYQSALNAGYLPSASNMGILYERGLGVPKDGVKAREFYRRAAEGGFAQGQVNLGLAYRDGVGGEPDPVEALKWFRLAAAQENTHGMVHVGRAYWRGSGVSKDSNEALRWFKRAAEKSDPLAYENLGLLYSDESEPFYNGAEALRYFQKAAEAGSLEAYHAMYLSWVQAQVDATEEEARQWLTRAAEGGLPNAQCELGFYYEKRMGWIPYQRSASSNNMPEAIKWYQRSADGNSAAGKFWLAECYLAGKGVDQDEARGVELMRESANLLRPAALNRLAELYSQGIGEPRNAADRPIALLHRAAELGHGFALRPLEQRYQNGQGVERDYVKAGYWHLRGHVRQGSLDDKLKQTTGPDPYSTTVVLFLKTILHKDSAAATQIAGMYASGRNVPKDNIEALAWLQFASRHGADIPREQQSRLEAMLTPKEIETASQRSAELAREIERLQAE